MAPLRPRSADAHTPGSRPSAAHPINAMPPMPHRPIARSLGRSDGATKVLIHRAIKQLEEEMSANGG